MTTQATPLSPKALERHIKRHVLAAEHEMVAITPPELAPVCLEECRAIGLDGRISEAGVEFTTGIEGLYLANLALRTASRILLRLPAFRAGTREELFFKASRTPWELWLNPAVPIDVTSHVEASRVNHEGQVTEAIIDGIRKRFRDLHLEEPQRPDPQAPPSPPDAEAERQKILVRLRSNHCGVSLDTSGAHLHMRGYRTSHAGAPLRETLAAGILARLDWTGREPLVDGMCGSGTFGIEGALIALGLPPGRHRSFLFQQWPSFQPKRWEYLNRTFAENAPDAPLPRMVGIDMDPGAIAIARANAERAGVGGSVEWIEGDFFGYHPSEHGLAGGVLVLNPPYGIRLSKEDPALYERIGEHIRSHYRGWRVAVLAPGRAAALRLGLGKARYWNLVHGGLPIVATLARIQAP